MSVSALARSGLWGLLLCLAGPAVTRIERIDALQCSGGGESFTIIFDHKAQTASVSDRSGTVTYAYEQGDAFLTWRLLDKANHVRYALREGDKINGDLGWYFTSLTIEADGTPLMTVSGSCSIP